MIAAFLTGLGLAASSGLNAYLPLLILALSDRFSGFIDLQGRWAVISSVWVIIALLIVLPLELIGDKIPRFDHLNDLFHSLIRPFAGGICMAAISSQSDGYRATLAFVIGLAVAGGIHLFKMRARPRITKATAGIGNPIQSMVEDAAVVAVSVLAVFMTSAIVFCLPLAAWLVWSSSRSLQSPSGRLSFLYSGRR